MIIFDGTAEELKELEKDIEKNGIPAGINMR